MADERDRGQLATTQSHTSVKDAQYDDFVLEKNIFSNIFEKDIRRVFIYKKAERLAKAIHLIAPAFSDSPSLRNRIDAIAVGLVDAATLPPLPARDALSRELLALSSVLGIARAGNLLSPMNAALIAREAHLLLTEVAAYEEPRLFLDDSPSLADIAKRAGRPALAGRPRASAPKSQTSLKGHKKDTVPVKDAPLKDRQSVILDILRGKDTGIGIKQISSLIRDVSEKTIQRELQVLTEQGSVRKEGERRWSTYYIV